MKTTVGIKQLRAFFIQKCIREMRVWARAKRTAKFIASPHGYPSYERLQENYTFGAALGISSAAHSFALSLAGHDAALLNRLDQLDKRRTRIIHAKVLRRPGERPAMFVQAHGSDTKPPIPLVVLLDANEEDKDLCDWAKQAKPGEEYQAGGGAAPDVVIRRAQ